jgi:hypothetical protein
MDRHREIIKSLIKKQEENIERFNQNLFKGQVDRERLCLKADYFDGRVFKEVSIIEDNLTPNTELNIEDVLIKENIGKKYLFYNEVYEVKEKNGLGLFVLGTNIKITEFISLEVVIKGKFEEVLK